MHIEKIGRLYLNIFFQDVFLDTIVVDTNVILSIDFSNIDKVLLALRRCQEVP